MSGLIPLIHGDFDNRFEHGELVWSYKLKLKKHVNYLKQLIFVWVEENEPMKYPNYNNELPIKLIRLWIGSQYYMLI